MLFACVQLHGFLILMLMLQQQQLQATHHALFLDFNRAATKLRKLNKIVRKPFSRSLSKLQVHSNDVLVKVNILKSISFLYSCSFAIRCSVIRWFHCQLDILFSTCSLFTCAIFFRKRMGKNAEPQKEWRSNDPGSDGPLFTWRIWRNFNLSSQVNLSLEKGYPARGAHPAWLPFSWER